MGSSISGIYLKQQFCIHKQNNHRIECQCDAQHAPSITLDLNAETFIINQISQLHFHINRVLSLTTYNISFACALENYPGIVWLHSFSCDNNGKSSQSVVVDIESAERRMQIFCHLFRRWSAKTIRDKVDNIRGWYVIRQVLHAFEVGEIWKMQAEKEKKSSEIPGFQNEQHSSVMFLPSRPWDWLLEGDIALGAIFYQ